MASKVELGLKAIAKAKYRYLARIKLSSLTGNIYQVCNTDLVMK